MIKILTDAENRNFLRLWLAQLISQFGDRIHQLALVGLIAERASGSTMDLAKLISFTILPVFVIQPFAGVYVDRWDQKTTLFVCDLFRGALVLLIPTIFIFWESIIPIYMIVFLAFCFSRFHLPAKMSILPTIVDKPKLLMANSLVSTTGMIAFVLGCAIGGFLIDWFGSRNGFLIDAGTFFLSGIIIFSMDMSKRLKVRPSEFVKTSREVIGPLRKSVWAEIREGFRYIIHHKEIRFVINIFFMLLAAAGAVYVVLIVFIQQAFGSVTKDLGVLAVCLGAGLFTGAIAYGKWGKQFVWHRTIFFSLTSGGLMLILFALIVALHPHLLTAMVLAFLWGLVIGPIFIASNTIVHLVSEENMRGKVFSALEIVIHLAFLVTMLLSSWISEFVPPVSVLITVGLFITVTGGVGLIKSLKGKLALNEGDVA